MAPEISVFHPVKAHAYAGLGVMVAQPVKPFAKNIRSIREQVVLNRVGCHKLWLAYKRVFVKMLDIVRFCVLWCGPGSVNLLWIYLDTSRQTRIVAKNLYGGGCMRKWLMVLMMAACVGAVGQALTLHSASSSDIDKLTSYAVIYGRAIACGISVQGDIAKTGAWIDRTFLGSEKSTYLRIFMEGMEYHAQEQSAGRSPDSCSAVRAAYNKMSF